MNLYRVSKPSDDLIFLEISLIFFLSLFSGVDPAIRKIKGERKEEILMGVNSRRVFSVGRKGNLKSSYTVRNEEIKIQETYSQINIRDLIISR